MHLWIITYSFPDHGLQVMYCWTKVAVYFTVDRVCSISYGHLLDVIHVCMYNTLNWGKRGCESI